MVQKVKKKFEIIILPKRYEDSLDELVESLDIDSLDWTNSLNLLRVIDKRSCNVYKFRSDLLTLIKVHCLDDNIKVISLELTSKIHNSQIYLFHNVSSFDYTKRRV